MSFPQGGGQGGKNEGQIITGREALLKMSIRVILFFLRANTVGPSARKLNKKFVHSFIHSFILI
jgi:hypothetical protein